MATGRAWPGPEERKYLSRFYVAVGLSQALYIIYPFEFAYLYLVMERPEWSVLPLIIGSATSLIMQLPTGVIADKWGRKAAVLTGGSLSSLTFLAVPSAASLHGVNQLLGVSAAFAFIGLGQTLMMGAQEAWVVDNLYSVSRSDLVEAFFARTYSVTALGGVIAGGVAFALLVSFRVNETLLDFLWYGTAIGFFAALGVALKIHEYKDASHSSGDDPPLLPRMKSAVRILFHTKPLLYLTIAIFIANVSSAGADQAFPVSLLTKHLDARALAPLAILEDVFGIAAPLLSLALVRRYGSEKLLSRSLVLAGALVTVLFAYRSLAVVVVLLIALGFIDRMWDPVSLARLQDDIPSMHRAAINSLVYQSNGVAELAGLGLLGVLLGSKSSQLRAATPDLVEAFSGHTQTVQKVPTSLFGLPVPDLAILSLVLVGILAVPFIALSTRARRRPGPQHPQRQRTRTP